MYICHPVELDPLLSVVMMPRITSHGFIYAGVLTVSQQYCAREVHSYIGILIITRHVLYIQKMVASIITRHVLHIYILDMLPPSLRGMYYISRTRLPRSLLGMYYMFYILEPILSQMRPCWLA